VFRLNRDEDRRLGESINPLLTAEGGTVAFLAILELSTFNLEEQ